MTEAQGIIDDICKLVDSGAKSENIRTFLELIYRLGRCDGNLEAIRGQIKEGEIHDKKH